MLNVAGCFANYKIQVEFFPTIYRIPSNFQFSPKHSICQLVGGQVSHLLEKREADAKSTPSYFLGHTYLGIIMSLSDRTDDDIILELF